MTPRVVTKYRDGFDRSTEWGPERLCSTCREWWPLNFFTPAKGCRLGRSFRCSTCRNRRRNAIKNGPTGPGWAA